MLLEIAHERDEDIPALIYEARGVRLCYVSVVTLLLLPCSSQVQHVLPRGIAKPGDIPAVQLHPAPRLLS